eukprot:TRINITY_DN23037_c0_g1_i1.p1 TRINITY_DN23037_c0_g1~~TRINITY_DN23037_c0_g1_i1.p1  ORF type:complete len:937 (-),score=201.23 TRINITY_DN23037_c0_g1_i1:99-2909(-)
MFEEPMAHAHWPPGASDVRGMPLREAWATMGGGSPGASSQPAGAAAGLQFPWSTSVPGPSASAGQARQRLLEPFPEPLSLMREAPVSPPTKADRQDIWKDVWDAFEQVEKAFPGGNPAMRALSEALCKAETELGSEGPKLTAKSSPRKFQVAAQVLHRLGASCSDLDAHLIFSSWRREAVKAHARGLRSRVDAVHKRTQRSQQVLDGAQRLGDFQMQKHLLKNIVQSWRLMVQAWARVAGVCLRHALAASKESTADAARILVTVFATWKHAGAERARDRGRRKAALDQRGFEERHRAHEATVGALAVQLEELARRHDSVGEGCVAAFAHLEQRVGSASGEPTLAVPAPLVLLYRERLNVVREIEAVGHQSRQLREQLQEAQEESLALQNQNVGMSATASRRAEDLQLTQHHIREDLEALRGREAGLAQELAKLDHRLDQSIVAPEELLRRGAHALQARLDRYKAEERRQVEELRASLERAESSVTAGQAEVLAEQRRAAESVAATRAECDAELQASQQRTEVLESELKDAKLWVDHLREATALKGQDRERLEGQERQLIGIRKALGELTDISAACFVGGPPTSEAGNERGAPSGSGKLSPPPLRSPRNRDLLLADVMVGGGDPDSDRGFPTEEPLRLREGGPQHPSGFREPPPEPGGWRAAAGPPPGPPSPLHDMYAAPDGPWPPAGAGVGSLPSSGGRVPPASCGVQAQCGGSSATGPPGWAPNAMPPRDLRHFPPPGPCAWPQSRSPSPAPVPAMFGVPAPPAVAGAVMGRRVASPIPSPPPVAHAAHAAHAVHGRGVAQVLLPSPLRPPRTASPLRFAAAVPAPLTAWTMAPPSSPQALRAPRSLSPSPSPQPHPPQTQLQVPGSPHALQSPASRHAAKRNAVDPLFEQLDTNKDGVISREEFQHGERCGAAGPRVFEELGVLRRGVQRKDGS